MSMSMNTDRELTKYICMVKEKGELPALTFPGFYPLFYLTEQDEVLCNECGTKRVKEVATHDVHWEGQSIYCDECGCEIESAYGDPEEEEE